MADELPRADETQRGHRRWVRDWFPYERYQSIHQSSMDALEREGLVLRDTLTFRELYDDSGELVQVNLRGRIVCAYRIVIMVNKWLDARRGRNNHYEVKGQFYSYQAYRRGRPLVNVLRYDSAHGGLHRHFFDHAGREISIQNVSYQSLPRLDLAIREAVALIGGPPV